MRTCIMYYLTILANLALIVFVLLLAINATGNDKALAFLLLLPPFLSLITIYKGGDREERALKKRLRKAHLRKELKELKEFDS